MQLSEEIKDNSHIKTDYIFYIYYMKLRIFLLVFVRIISQTGNFKKKCGAYSTPQLHV